jgi:hypothetical protein
MNEHMNWDDEIKNDGEAPTLIEPGIYPFKIKNLEKTISKGAKTAGAPMAILEVRVEHDEGEYADIRDQIVLTRNLEWKLCQFFTAIGQRKKGETLHPRWNAVIGSKGFCEVVIEEYTKKDGTPGKSAKVGKYLDPEEYAKTVAAATEEDDV